MSTQFKHQDVEDYIYPRVINWIRVIDDIREHGGTYSTICKILGLSWSTLQGWRTGCEPRHSTGSSLLLIHAKYCGTELTKQRVLEAELK